MREFNRIWCNDCGDSWSSAPFVAEDADDANNTPCCPCCNGEDTSPMGEGEPV